MTANEKNIFIIMPAYNAGKTVERVFERIPRHVADSISRYIIVDDGSSDDTASALERVATRFEGTVILRHSRNKGYGAAEKTLLNSAVSNGVDIAILLHADGQYSPEKMPDLLEPLLSGDADIVQGSRMLEGGAMQGGMPFYKYLANKILTGVENFGFGMSMAEFHSGYMLYSRRVLEAIDFNRLSNSFDFDLEMLVCAKTLGLRIKEVAIPTIYADEISYLNPIKYGLDVLSVVRKYRSGYYHGLVRDEWRKQ